MTMNMKKNSLNANKHLLASYRKRFALAAAAYAVGLLGALSVGCSVRTPGTQTPVPYDQSNFQGVEKAFFEEVVTDNVMVSPEERDAEGRVMKAAKYERRTVRRPKTFLCGWAPISETGFISHMVNVHKVQMTSHCNVEFEIQQDQVLGRLINPSFPNDRNRWKPFVAIPITRHFTYERARDGFQRDTNEFIENTNQHAWSARPNMTLDLARTTILGGIFGDGGLFAGSPNGMVLAAEDVEWDRQNGFLGFTLNGLSAVFGSENAARFRFNFMAFKHNPDFKATPYNSQNARHLNALHILGERVDGVSPILYAARWDLSKKRKIYMHGMPPQNVPIARESLTAFNKAFKDIGAASEDVFELSEEPSNKYGFDLRYPTMTWVEDQAISLSSPLGVGMALADVKNGEILWGTITMFGGYLERYIKAYLPGADGAGAPGAMKTGSVNVPPLGVGFFSPRAGSLNPLDLTRFSITPQSIGSLAQRLGSNQAMSPEAIQQEMRRLESREADLRSNEGSATAAQREAMRNEITQRRRALDNQLKSLASGSDSTSQIVASQMAQELQKLQGRSQQALASKSIQEHFGFFGVDDDSIKSVMSGLVAHDSATQINNALFNAISQFRDGRGGQMISSSNPALRNALRVVAERMAKQPSSVIMDLDRTFADVAPGWAAAIQSSGGKITYEEAYRIVVKELILHELGHMFGLGHQFKENILPAEGTVPQSIYNELKAKADKDMTNATSVMGYKSPTTELAEPYDQIALGHHDLLVLRYLYNQEYATFKRGDSKFEFFKVPESGIIPPNNPEKPEYKTSYFPQCNDFHASLSLDPYCNRFDRGHDAETIVKSYFEDLNDNLVANIYAFTDARGGNPWMAESMLWSRALSTMGRIRLFYDYMRQKYAPQIERIAANEKDIYEFSRACSGEIAGSSDLQKLFKDRDGKETELGQLCRVNRMAVRNFQSFLVNPGPDNTRMDWDNSYTPAGMTGGDAQVDSSRMFGTRTALSVLPLKMSALNALTTPRPYMFLGSWMWPIPRYDGDQGLFSYSSLYPFEFTQATAAALEKNVQFSNDQGAEARMGRTAAAMGYFLSQIQQSNDAGRFPREFNNTIRLQFDFRLSLVAVVLKFVGRSANDVRKTHMETSIVDIQTGREINGGESYLLPGGKVIVRGPNRNFIYPITRIAFLADEPSDTRGYVIAYRIDYDTKHEDLLASHSMKTALEKLHKNALDTCLIGPSSTGLSTYFNAQTAQSSPEEYPGFDVLKGVIGDPGAQVAFQESIRKQFELFETYRNKNREPKLAPLAPTCEKALDNLGLVVTSAALLDGYFLPEALDYMSK